MEYIDPNTGTIWTRSEDGKTWTNNLGQTLIGHQDIAFEQLLLACEQIANPLPVKSDAERIAELEAQLAALLSRL